jgi:PAS domain S-box-containing protein
MVELYTETQMMQRVLLVTEDPSAIRLVREIFSQLTRPLFYLEHASTETAALDALKEGGIGLVLFDYTPREGSKAGVLTGFATLAPHVPILVLSDLEDPQLASQLLREGAQDYHVKRHIDARLLVRSMRYAIKRKRTEIALAREQDLLRGLLDNIPDRIYFKDKQSRFIRINPALAVHFGLKEPREALGRTDFDFFLRDHAQAAFNDEQKIMATGEPIIGIMEKETHPDGRVTWAFTSKLPLRDKDGRIAGTFGVSRDITELKITEEKLKESNSDLLQSREELLRALSDLQRSTEELKAAQFQLCQSAKFESMGILAAGVAHEVKNPLQTLLMGLDYLTERFRREDGDVKTVLEEMQRSLIRADGIVRELLEFSAANTLNLTEENLNTVVEKSLGLIQFQLNRTRIRLVKDLDQGLPAICLDKNKIEQVLINVFVNALQAMTEGGILTIRTGLIPPAEGLEEQGLPSKSEEPVARIEIEDTGTGISEENLPKIFDPFFTTKPAGQGTGLGLSVTRRIIEMHSGGIQIMNNHGGGAKVVINLKLKNQV